MTSKATAAKRPNFVTESSPKSSPVHAVPSDDKPEPGAILASFSDKELVAFQTALKQEVRRRRVERESKLPQPGAKVLITGGDKRYVGKSGMVMNSRKTRAFVQVTMPDGKFEVTYARLTDIRPSTGEAGGAQG